MPLLDLCEIFPPPNCVFEMVLLKLLGSFFSIACHLELESAQQSVVVETGMCSRNDMVAEGECEEISERRQLPVANHEIFSGSSNSSNLTPVRLLIYYYQQVMIGRTTPGEVRSGASV